MGLEYFEGEEADDDDYALDTEIIASPGRVTNFQVLALSGGVLVLLFGLALGGVVLWRKKTKIENNIESGPAGEKLLKESGTTGPNDGRMIQELMVLGREIGEFWGKLRLFMDFFWIWGKLRRIWGRLGAS